MVWYKKDIDSYRILNLISNFLKNGMRLNIDMDLTINFIPNSTINSPTRVKYENLNNLYIKGNNHIINMAGATEEYLTSIDDKSSSGRDIFTAFSFIRCDNIRVENLNFAGTYATSNKFRYQSPRAKCIGFNGCANCTVVNIKSKNVLGNVVNATPVSNTYDSQGVYRVCENIIVDNCSSDGSWENAYNFMGGTKKSVIKNCSSKRAGSCCVEIGGENNKVINCYSENDRYGFAIGGENNIISTSTSINSIINSLNITGVNSLVKNSYFKDSKFYTLQIYPNSNDIVFMNNIFENNLGEDSEYNFMFYSFFKKNVKFINNIIINNMLNKTTLLLRGEGILLKDNVILQKETQKQVIQYSSENEKPCFTNNIINGGNKLYLQEKPLTPININNIVNGILLENSGTQEPTEYISTGTYFFNTKTKDAKFFDGTNWITYQKLTSVSKLNTPYYARKMEKEGVLQDFDTYMDEKYEYDKKMEQLERDKQKAYEEELKTNPDLSYEEFINLYNENHMMILPIELEEPKPSQALQQFIDKWL